MSLENVENENYALKQEIKDFEASAEVNLEMKMKNMQVAFNNAKIKSELQEKQICEFREEWKWKNMS